MQEEVTAQGGVLREERGLDGAGRRSVRRGGREEDHRLAARGSQRAGESTDRACRLADRQRDGPSHGRVALDAERAKVAKGHSGVAGDEERPVRRGMRRGVRGDEGVRSETGGDPPLVEGRLGAVRIADEIPTVVSRPDRTQDDLHQRA